MKLEPPNNLDQLCLDLGIGLKRRARLSEEKGKSLIPWLQKVWLWTRRQDRGRFLHPHATAASPDYVDNPGAGMREEPEAVPGDYQNVLVTCARERWVGDQRREQADREMSRDVQRLNQEMLELAKRAVKMGIDPMTVLAPVAGEIQKQHREIKRAA